MSGQNRQREEPFYRGPEGPSGVRRVEVRESVVPPTMPSPAFGAPLPAPHLGLVSTREARPESLLDQYRVVARVAEASSEILITGQSSVGRQLLARAVHAESPRHAAPFVAVPCRAIPEALLESELFGRAHSPFAGAHPGRVGHLTLASEGTLFLDEIDALPLGIQIKLLRVLQVREYFPVGDIRARVSTARVIAGSAADLGDAVSRGAFLKDLYDRVSVIRLGAPTFEPPSALVNEEAEFDPTDPTSSPIASAGADFEPFPSPPRLPGDGIRSGAGPELKLEPEATARLPEGGVSLRQAVDAFEELLIRQALDRTKWNKGEAAALLRISRTTFIGILKRKGIVRTM